jgi:hypothetical protein
MIEGIVALVLDDEEAVLERNGECEGSTCEGDDGCMCQQEG